MIGLVLVSHSAPLAAATAELAAEMAGDDPPPVRVAAGADGGGLGTDAVAIAAAIDELAGCEGVVVLPDLGSAVLSAELALELRESEVAVVISDGPFVEGATVAVVAAAGGADLAVVAAAASDALRVKRRDDPEGTLRQAQGPAPQAQGPDRQAQGPDRQAQGPDGQAQGPDRQAQGPDPDAHGQGVEIVLPNPQGLHARPAAVLVRTVGPLDATVTVTDLTAGRGPADAASVIALLALGAVGGHTLRIDARGPDADHALEAVTTLVREGFGEIRPAAGG